MSEVVFKKYKGAKFTFKTTVPTGRYRAFDYPTIYIKLRRMIVGIITNDRDTPPHHIRLMVEKNDKFTDNNPNCLWMWITLKKPFASVQEAKEFLNTHIEQIMSKYNLFGENDA